MGSDFDNSQIDSLKWFTWIEYPGYSYRDLTSWKLEIDSEGQLVQNLYSKPFCKGEPKESHAARLSFEELEEMRRRIGEINFPRLEELAYLGHAKDCSSCHLQIGEKDSLIKIQTSLPMVFNGVLGLRSRTTMSKSASGKEEFDFESDLAEIRQLVTLLKWILSRCPIQRWHWKSDNPI